MEKAHISNVSGCEDDKSMFALATELKNIAFGMLEVINHQRLLLPALPASKRIFLFFLTKAIKTYSAIIFLCQKGFGQDVCLLLRSLLEALISARYILYDEQQANVKAIRFVEYKWILFKRNLSQSDNLAAQENDPEYIARKVLIEQRCLEFKEKYRIVSDKALLTWSGKSIRDMAKAADRQLLKEYDKAFRFFSRFSHPNIVGDNEYLQFTEESLIFKPTPSLKEVDKHLNMAMVYLLNFLAICETLFGTGMEEIIKTFKNKLSASSFDSGYGVREHDEPDEKINRERAEKMVIEFEIPNEK